MRNSILTLSDVSKAYDKQIVLSNITFDIKQGEFLSILGSSGCGKSTLLRLLCGIESASIGKVLKQGQDIVKLKPAERNMGIIFQNYALFQNMTAYENVAYALKARRLPKQEIQSKVDEILKVVGLFEHKDKKPALLSGGQQQRCAIARTLVLKPDIILFDEPMSALDANIKAVLRNLIKQIQSTFGTTIVYVTPDVEEAFTLSDRILLINDSKIVQIDTPSNMYHSPANEFVRSFIVDALDNKLALIKENIS